MVCSLRLKGFEKGNFFSKENSETLEGDSSNFMKRERERITSFFFPLFCKVRERERERAIKSKKRKERVPQLRVIYR